MRVLYSYDGPIAGLHDNVTSAIRPFGTPNHTYKKSFSIPGMGIIDPSSPLDPQYPAGQESKDSFRIVSCVGIPPRHVAFPAITTVLPCACALAWAAMAALTGRPEETSLTAAAHVYARPCPRSPLRGGGSSLDLGSTTDQSPASIG